MASRSIEESRRVVAEAVAACTSLPTSVLDNPDGIVGKTFDDLAFDSLAFMEFCIAIHVETGIELDVATVADMGSPDAVARYLSEVK